VADLGRWANMDGYLQLFDSARYGRAFGLRILAKFISVVVLIASLFFIAGDTSGTASKLLGGGLLVIGITVGYWGFRPKYPCPRCCRKMRVSKKKAIGGRDLFLTCEDCKVCIDLKIQEE
jgi:hypothetical protein